MSITPVDKPPDGDEPQDNALSRRSSRVREYVGRFFSWLGTRLSSASGPADDDRSYSADVPVARGETDIEPKPVEPTDCSAFRNFPGRDQPLTHPARNSSGINTPDVVSIETDQGLRLSVPENPDAEMTSDVWMPVEP